MLGAMDTSTAIEQAQQVGLANNAASLAHGRTMAQIQKSAQDFESVFATEMLSPMFDEVEVDPQFGGGHGEEMFRTLIVDQYGKEMGKNDTFGIAKDITSALLKIQEGKH